VIAYLNLNSIIQDLEKGQVVQPSVKIDQQLQQSLFALPFT